MQIVNQKLMMLLRHIPKISEFTVIELITYTQGNFLSIYPYLTDITGNYFANIKVESWKLKYSLDNDTRRFAWADSSVNGKGVIYQNG